VLYGNATATDVTTGKQVTLNLQDPDSMTVAPNGDLVFTSQSDNELVDVHNPGTSGQKVELLPLSDAANKLPQHGVDDTLFNPGATGEILMTDQTTGAIYQVTVPAGSTAQAYSAAQDAGELGITNLSTGLFTPVISGLGSPRGLAFLNAGAFTDLSQYTLVDASTDPQGANDPNLINDTTTNVLLTEKYDDLKVNAILKEIQGKKSHDFTSKVDPEIPAIFGMNFQAVSVAQKDAHGGINLLPNGQEGAPSAILEGAMMHTDASVGKIVAALKAAGIWDSTDLYLTAKHGQDPRVGLAGLMSDSTLPNLLNKAGDTVAQATQDDVSLIWLQNQAQTFDAVATLQALKANGTIDVYFQGVKQTLPASDVIDKIIADTSNADASPQSYDLGNPATDSTTPDIVVTLKPGYIWVGNVNNQHKRAEHGGFSDDDTHVALIVSGGAIDKNLRGTKQTEHVDTTQIAVSVLEQLGLDPSKLTGAVTDGTTALPGLGLAVGVNQQAVEGQKLKDTLVGTFTDAKATSTDDFKVTINWGDGTKVQSKGISVVETAAHTFAVYASHTFKEAGTFDGTLVISALDGFKATTIFQSTVAEANLTGIAETINAVSGKTFDGEIATFKDANKFATAKDFVADIDWGDGTTSKGTITLNSDGVFVVKGSHDYKTAGDFNITIDLLDEGTPSGTIHSKAKVTKA
jgi:hypothetical protein